MQFKANGIEGLIIGIRGVWGLLPQERMHQPTKTYTSLIQVRSVAAADGGIVGNDISLHATWDNSPHVIPDVLLYVKL